jgi:ATPase, P-type (transporting), HAD superfamily, subfamily IC
MNVNRHGLTSEEALKRVEVYGENALEKKKKKSALSILLSQFNDFMIWVLFGATAISAIMGEKADAITITAIIVVNGILGFIQEYKTERSMEALKELTAPKARVIRDGKNVSIPAKEVVPDDLILIEAGDRVPADALLIESSNIQVDESILTGESVPVDKKYLEKTIRDSFVGLPENTVYMGTIVTGGRGKAVVISTGMATEMGKIADMLQNVQEGMTPLQKRLDKMGRIMVYGCLIICALVTATGILKGADVYTMFLTGVSLAVAAIPEGLPAIVTVALAIGVQRMLNRNALVRKLPAVETLGCTNVICSDKTGTLTENKMTVKSIYCDGSFIDVTGSGYDISGEFIREGKKAVLNKEHILNLLLSTAVSCSNSEITVEKQKGKILQLGKPNLKISSTSGDPTEIALLVCAYKADIDSKDISRKYMRIDEIPFDSNRKRMSVVVKHGEEYYVFLKGAIDTTIDLCDNIEFSYGVKKFTSSLKNTILSCNDRMASKALRVLALSYKKLPGPPARLSMNSIESGMTFLGLIGMIDPPRPEAIEAVELCKVAGIKPVMITGDHKETAIAVAKELKIMDSDSLVLSGKELDRMDDKSLDIAVRNASVFARVTPKHKLRIVKAYKNDGYIVAMTGDGVNDAPAVKEADIGISMGKTGTDVTKEASSMILLDDNFATIVAAVEEGRIIYDNIRKFIRYLLSCNLGEVLTMFIASLLGLPIPLIPIQILWVNLVTDGLPAIALGVDPPDKGIMLRPARKKDESIFSQGLSHKILIRGVLIGLCTLIVFVMTLYTTSGNLMKARTMAFATLVMSQLVHVFECKSERNSIFDINLFNNIYLVGAVTISILMLSIAIYMPALQPVFKTASLSLGDWVEVMFFSAAIAIIVNVWTFIKNNSNKPR